MRAQPKAKPVKLSRRRALRAALMAPPAIVLSACAPNQRTPAKPESAAVAVTLVPTQKLNQSQPTDSPAKPSAPTPLPEPTATIAPVAQTLPPTPACNDADDVPTPARTEGPYFTPNSPERASFLEPDMAGTRIVLTGYVLTTQCKSTARVLLDFWQCDNAGQYDNSGYTLRGHFFTDEAGRWSLETVVPGLYPGRTRHFHVKVQAPNNPVLTSQLFFPNEPGNARDGIYNSKLLIDMQDDLDGSKRGTFNFVLNVA